MSHVTTSMTADDVEILIGLLDYEIRQAQGQRAAHNRDRDFENGDMFARMAARREEIMPKLRELFLQLGGR